MRRFRNLVFFVAACTAAPAWAGAAALGAQAAAARQQAELPAKPDGVDAALEATQAAALEKLRRSLEAISIAGAGLKENLAGREAALEKLQHQLDTMNLKWLGQAAIREEEARLRWSEQEQERRARAEEAKARAEEMRLRTKEREDQLYERATAALDEGRWERAAELFAEAGKGNARRADGALYWQAYALNKQGKRDAALQTVQTLISSYPNSRWLNDAKALELEIRQSAGQPVSPQGERDDDLVLLALSGLQHSDPEQSAPILEKFLRSNRPPKLKERALFVLAQSGSPKARQVVAQIARGSSNPDLQLRAIKYLGVFGGQENAQTLADVYQSSSDPDVKRAILRSFMVSGQRDRVLAAAKTEGTPELRQEAIRQLGVMGAQTDLWQLYGSESSIEVKEQILRALFIGGNSEKMLEVARNEKEPRLRRAAIHNLGIMGANKTGDALVSLYAAESSPDIRREIVKALFVQGNAGALVSLARKETDPAMKKEIVRQLSVMGSKEATDFMMELLNK